MAYIEHRKTKAGTPYDLVFLDKGDLAITKMRCPKCDKTISVKSSETWISTKCLCQCALVYPISYINGRMDIITLEQHKERGGVFHDKKRV